jgi:hypothetical protein
VTGRRARFLEVHTVVIMFLRILPYDRTYCSAKVKIRIEGVGSGGLAPLVRNLDTRWRRVVSFTPQILYFRYPLNRRAGSLELVWTLWSKNSLAPEGN